MVSAARLWGPVAACATLLAAGVAVEPARAQGEACKPDVITATGRGKFRPFTKTKELEGRGSAMADAVKTWQREVSARFGDRWNEWSRAADSNFTCAPTKTGKIIGSSFIGCTITGRPCASPAAAESGQGSARTRERDGGREGPRWSGRYGREMARQSYLAAQRTRAESRTWHRENARQGYLAKQRDRAETRAVQRANARQRYWEDDD